MNTIQIKCFVEAAQCCNFTKAAENLFMTQPALSKNIAALEEELQVKLFDRDPHHVTCVTPAGQLLLDCIVRMMTDFSLVLERARNIENGINGTITLGILEGQMLDDRLKLYITLLGKEYPKLHIQMKRGSFCELINCLENGEMDAIVTLDWDVWDKKNFECCELYKLPTKLIVPQNFDIPCKEHLSLKDFSELPFVCVSESDSPYLMKKINAACEKAGFTPKIDYVSDMRKQILSLEVGKGMAGFNMYHMICHSPNVKCVDVTELLAQKFVLCFVRGNKNPCISFMKKVYYEVFD